jgi:mannonate dehydratase
MKLGLFLSAKAGLKWKTASQMGIKYAVVKAAPELTGELPPWDFDTLKKIKDDFDENGLELYSLEGDEFDMSRIKLGLPGRDEDIGNYKKMLRNMGELGIPMICVNFMAKVGWFRSKFDIKARGEALTSGFDIKDINKEYETIVTEEQMWDNFTYFIKAIMPTAEEAGVKIALHPDDPPISPFMGVSRILTSAQNFRKALEIGNSPNLGITFCQASFKAMGEDIFKLIDEFGKNGKIFFVHLRDIKGTKECFHETFHDNGPTDMSAAFEAYRNAGVDCLLRPDHAPTMAGESNETPGYEMMGKIFAIGYIKGLLEALNINYK